MTQGDRRKHDHYFKNVEHLKQIDVYRVLALFQVSDPCLQHAIKKLLVAGGRGAGKDAEKGVREASDSLARWLQMKAEDCGPAQMAALHDRGVAASAQDVDLFEFKTANIAQPTMALVSLRERLAQSRIHHTQDQAIAALNIYQQDVSAAYESFFPSILPSLKPPVNGGHDGR